MKIKIDGAIIHFIPETQEEIKDLDHLWKVIGMCETENRKLLPLGHFVPGVSESAQFYVEGLKAKSNPYTSTNKIRYVCMVCNRMEEYPETSPNAICYGKPMYRMD